MGDIEITFVREYEIKDGTGTKFRVGQSLKCNESSANHFINRGAAMLSSDYKKAAAEKAAAEKKNN